MSITAKIWIRTVVITGLVAWPALETYRLWDTTQKVKEAQALERSVRAKLEVTRAKHVQVATTTTEPAKQ
jgi:hypothetical protein